MYSQLKRIAVIGGGSWATAIIKMLCDNVLDKEIFWWMRCEESINHVKKFHHNPNYLSSVEIEIPEQNITNNLIDIIAQADYIILNIPAAFLKDALKNVHKEMFVGKKIVSAIKGIVPDENLIIADYMHEKFDIAYENFIVISGPCHAEEVAQEKLSYLTIASLDNNLALAFAKFIKTRYINTIISDDIYGTEYASVLKNIYAVASGICHGVGFGDNFQAVLISNAIRETERFLHAIHAIDRDIKETVYLGDLLVTAYSQFSRNRTFGNMIGKGYTVTSAQLEMNMIAEGYYAVNSIFEINKQFNVDLPIANAVYEVLYLKKSPQWVMKNLADKLS